MMDDVVHERWKVEVTRHLGGEERKT